MLKRNVYTINYKKYIQPASKYYIYNGAYYGSYEEMILLCDRR